MLTLTEEEFQELEFEMFRYNLQLPTDYTNLDKNFMRKCYNGAGSDDTPYIIRSILTMLLKPCKAAILIHDIDFTTHACTFDQANDKFVYNCQRLIDCKFSRWNFFIKLHYGTLKIISNNFITAFGKKWRSKNHG